MVIDQYFQDLKNVSTIDDYFERLCPNFTLTNSVREVVNDSLKSLSQPRSSGYIESYKLISIEKQTDFEYADFQKKMESSDSAFCDCSKLEFLERKGSLTVYSKGYKGYCDETALCNKAPFFCPFSPFFLPLIIALLLLVAIIGALVIRFKK
jgi:hypothetical protein